MFYVEQMYVFNAPENSAEDKMFKNIQYIKMDLLRGIGSKLLLKKSRMFII